jgi:hypothetical protein
MGENVTISDLKSNCFPAYPDVTEVPYNKF